MKIRLLAITLAILCLLADYISKQWALLHLRQGMIVVNSILNFNLAFNPGAAFSFLGDGARWQKVFLISISTVVSLWLIFSILFEKITAANRIAFSFILSGAIGNLIDRLSLIDKWEKSQLWNHIINPHPGEVIDFIQFHYNSATHSFYYPIFNIADVAINFGIAIMIISFIVEMIKNHAK